MQTVLNILKGAITDLTALVYTPQCAACNAELLDHETQICMACLHTLSLPKLTPAEENPQYLKGLLGLELAGIYGLMVFRHGGKVQQLLHELKYYNKPELGHLLGYELGKRLVTEAAILPEILVPIPLHPKRKAARGYNQAEKIAEGIAQATGAKVSTDLILRPYVTESQTHKSRSDRLTNMSNAFEVNQSQLANHAGKSIMLVDDVLTTGATVGTCCKLLASTEIKALSIGILAYAE